MASRCTAAAMRMAASAAARPSSLAARLLVLPRSRALMAPSFRPAASPSSSPSSTPTPPPPAASASAAPPSPSDPAKTQPRPKEAEALFLEESDVYAQMLSQRKQREGAVPPQAPDAEDFAELTEEEAANLQFWREKAEAEERRRQAQYGKWLAGIVVVVLGGTAVILGTTSDKSGASGATSDGDGGLTDRIKDNSSKFWGQMTAPDEKILPDALPPPYTHEWTLCLELLEMLVATKWDVNVGWRAMVRPGAKDFLHFMGQQAELVIFSSDPGYIAEPIVRALDPYQMAMYNLYREHCHQGATPVKDLSRLNRRESAILTVDVDPKKHALQPQNGIVVPKWNGDPNDRYLYTLMDTLTEMLIFAQSQRGTPRGSLPELLTEMRGGRRDDSTPDVVATWTAFKQKARAEYAAVEAQRASERQQKGGLAAWLTGASIMSAQNAHAPPSNPIDRAEFLAREDRAVWARDREKNLAAIRLQHKQQEQQIIAMTENMKAEKKRLFDYMFAPPMAPAAAGAAPPAAPPSA